jgi:hypothetical protein
MQPSFVPTARIDFCVKFVLLIYPPLRDCTPHTHDGNHHKVIIAAVLEVVVHRFHYGEDVYNKKAGVLPASCTQKSLFCGF